jgi:hypothetical protein
MLNEYNYEYYKKHDYFVAEKRFSDYGLPVVQSSTCPDIGPMSQEGRVPKNSN